jgi:hypothetical protein
MDAWRFRDGGFDSFWKLMVADAAAAKVTEERTEGTARAPTPDAQVMLAAWTASHRGAVVAETDLSSLAPALTKALSAPVETRTIHPMRSAWWLIPFAGLLGIEWWQRRKNGHR